MELKVSLRVTHGTVLQDDVDASDLVLHFSVEVVSVERSPNYEVVATVVVQVCHREAVAKIRSQLVSRDVLQIDQVMRVDRNLIRDKKSC